jgi:hypothetical protein
MLRVRNSRWLFTHEMLCNTNAHVAFYEVCHVILELREMLNTIEFSKYLDLWHKRQCYVYGSKLSK